MRIYLRTTLVLVISQEKPPQSFSQVQPSPSQLSFELSFSDFEEIPGVAKTNVAVESANLVKILDFTSSYQKKPTYKHVIGKNFYKKQAFFKRVFS
ncbi:hypothetical protein AGMMS50296_8040 [Alphaproteobacteria bacterium]|nr:hypothetical protein AGMMS50296_8040 [Alphaproteobacteria bacterium]